ncbi:lipoprotein, partial [Mycoplasma capricolum subsp. capricolum]|nr:lipoprotein [Mycoplasma capricolum subsp. capricolum]
MNKQIETLNSQINSIDQISKKDQEKISLLTKQIKEVKQNLTNATTQKNINIKQIKNLELQVKELKEKTNRVEKEILKNKSKKE